MNKIKAVVFDMDGLMFDTEKLWIDAVKRANEENNYNIPVEFAISCIGKRTNETYKLLEETFGININKFHSLISDYMNEDIKVNGLRIKKGLKELLVYLVKNNYKIAIASSSEIVYVVNKLKEAGIDENIFTSIIGGDMVKKPKPDPYIYKKSCEVLGIEPNYVICLEDSDYGIESAYRAGLVPILIPDIKKPTEKTIKMAYKKLDSLLDVIDLLENK